MSNVHVLLQLIHENIDFKVLLKFLVKLHEFFEWFMIFVEESMSFLLKKATNKSKSFLIEKWYFKYFNETLRKLAFYILVVIILYSCNKK